MRFTRILRTAASAAKDKGVFLKLSNEEVLIRSTVGNPTGLTGIWQHPNPRPALIKVYDGTLDLLASKYPAESVYRQSVENMTKARKSIVETNEVSEVIEQKIGAGLIEEILIQASDEFQLAAYLADKEPWKELEEKPVADQWAYFDRM